MKIGRALGVGVALIAVLNALSALSMPVPARKVPLLLVAVGLALQLLHAAIYAWGERIRRRFDLRVYAGAQATALFAIALARSPAPLTLVLYMAAVAELVALAGSAWGSVRISTGAVGLLVAASFLTSDLYRAATDGAILACTGLIAYAIAGLLSRRALAAPPVALSPMRGAPPLSAREMEVLRALVNGARNSEIAAALGITERTVKAHLGTIYQKLGVTSRSAAVAAALQGKLTD